MCGSAQSGTDLPPDTRSMSLFHAVVWTDHRSAQVLQFDAENVLVRKVRTHTCATVQHGSEAPSQHAFFAELCDTLEGIAEVLATGAHAAIADFRHYADKHRPQTATRIVGYEVVDRPSEKQLVTLARRYFLEQPRTI